MQKARIGLKKTVFDLEVNEEEVYVKLTSLELDEDQNTIDFLQLKNCDVCELLRCVANCRVLESIECVIAVKTIVGQGKIYIRLIQRSL